MKVIYNPKEVFAQLEFARRNGRTIGMVPTMGALHEGHLSLIKEAAEICDLTVATIFVNPSQFGPNEDFQKYPRTAEEDLKKLASVKTDYVFIPTVEDMYPLGYSTYVEPPDIAQSLDGEFRPGHFRGVVTVVLKLFHMVPATAAFFGRKDYQQLQVIRRMVEDLNVPIRVESCPTLRESDGLAMSSRNRYLNADDRQRALGLWQALTQASKSLSKGNHNVRELEQQMRGVLENKGITNIDYARIVEAETMVPIDELNVEAIALIAARVGNTRLIDNLPLSPTAMAH